MTAAATILAATVVVVVVGLVVLVLLTRSQGGGFQGDGRSKVQPQPSASSAQPSAPPVRATAESAKKVKANEAGLIPVIMYHRILPKRIASIDRTPDQLRKELERLARSDYVPITAAELVAGKIDIPAGTHPVVLTFDDGHPSHFATDRNGMPKNDTAVGVIYEVAAKYPNFRPTATFWVNRDPFGLRDRAQQKKAVKWLLDHGFEVANHTYSHPDLHRLSNKGVSEQIVRQERLLKKMGVPSSTTFALPYGSRPRKLSRAHDGKWDGTGYHFDAVFLAGAEPTVSPFAKSFPRYAIPRIQSNGKHGDCRRWCTTYWLEWLSEHPKERYTSDGDPDRVSVPRKLRATLSPGRATSVITY
ncbi:polysaccharide deacetylase family protein [Microbispora sp. NBC_01189]|uniref:polysaccharide deacetylase family protein n=1 Tax=Microbispora sp. NBC_01189 TaxID=2903583 RepID=UPI002E134412|nr:polysaccharide deacetylase family protein [Microbispora sp. NBC_01189]